ncbi:hypothetical protein CPJCM30710_23740 [Clostridium polyendosporum]|uniref:Uncharacterized protein n=1 Tax=Clostridium polyendosporum TaxID=69208 RepID=A0A919S337_9CLOT|nr:hypothetical protein [Clostridium polyendosporum]GIM29708.1 hypothetical protein CPJCM30710_23740 [Clostridium polyendosporum]
MVKKLISNYIVYIIYFLGVGMVSSGIVLMPFNAVRYSIILSIGLLLFIAGSIFNEIVINQHHLSLYESLNLIIVSLTLAIGIGMISGGISHFKESPSYASYLIPMGIIISFVSFAIKNNYKLQKRDTITLTIAVFVITGILHLALILLGNHLFIDVNPGGDVFKPMQH